MPWGAVIAAVGAIGAGAMQSDAAKDAARQQSRGANASIAEQRRQFDTMLGLTAPQRQIGNSALNQLAVLTGLPQFQQQSPMSFEEWGRANPSAFVLPKKPKQGFLDKHLGHALDPTAAFKDAGIIGKKGGATGYDQARARYEDYVSDFNSGRTGGSSPKSDPRTNGGNTYEVMPDGSVRTIAAVGEDGAATGAPDYSAFFNTPDYQFALDQGLKATERSASARGGLRSGNTLAALTKYGQGLATQNFGNYISRLQSLAGLGSSASNNAGQNAMNLGINVGNTIQSGAGARASGIVGSANAWGDTANSLAQIGGNLYQQYRKPQTNYFNTMPVQGGYGYGGNQLRVA
jgi:hypothetical protein